MQTHLLRHKPESRQDLHIAPENQLPEGIETSPDRHELDTISAPDYPKTTGTTTSGLTGHDSPTADPSKTTNTPDISTCAQHAAHAHHMHQTPRHQTRKANHGATAALPIYPKTTTPNKEFETRATKPLDTVVARKKTHPQPTATYIASTSVSVDRTKTTKTTKDPTSTRQWPAPETTPPPNPPPHTSTPMKWPTSRTATPTYSSNDIAEEAAASAKPNTTCKAATTDTTTPTTPT